MSERALLLTTPRKINLWALLSTAVRMSLLVGSLVIGWVTLYPLPRVDPSVALIKRMAALAFVVFSADGMAWVVITVILGVFKHDTPDRLARRKAD